MDANKIVINPKPALRRFNNVSSMVFSTIFYFEKLNELIFDIVSPKHMSNVKVKEDVEKLYLENEKTTNDIITQNRSNSPIVIKDLHQNIHNRKVFLEFINR